MPPFFMEPRAVEYQDYVKIYQTKYQDLFTQLISTEAKLLVATEYATDLQELIINLQEENKTLQSKLNKRAAAKKPASNYQDASVD